MENISNTTDIPEQAKSLFDTVEALRATPITGDSALLEKILNHVPVRKPGKESFFRTHAEHSVDALVLELKEDGETLFVDPRLQEALLGEKCVCLRRLQLCVTRQGTAFIWPLRLPTEGRNDAWARTALDAATTALKRWTRIQADMGMGGYRVAVAKIEAEPVWPTRPFNEILKIAFNGSAIESLDHPALARLRGDL